MKSFIYAAAVSMLLIGTVGAKAQVKRFEIEPRIGIGTQTQEVTPAAVSGYDVSYEAFHHSPGVFQGALEFRYNLPEKPFDIAVECFASLQDRKYNKTPVPSESDAFRPNDFYDIVGHNFNVYAASFFLDVRPCNGKVAPFAGIGAGPALTQKYIPGKGAEDRAVGMVLTPRVGVRFFGRLSLTADARITRPGYSSCGISLGYSFGWGESR